ncbi:MAG: rhamnogalacturonan lyase [Planctomycetota bacterium]|nr:rhamnogalacturonan lyase [Planctomycetota bacterium]
MRALGNSLIAAWIVFICIADAQAQPQFEKLDRGLVALNQGKGNGVFLSWRLLGSDARSIGFNVYRQVGSASPEKLNAQPLTAGTNFLDPFVNLDLATSYYVRPVDPTGEGEACKPFAFASLAPQRDYLAIPLQTPAGYTAGDASPADLDGDGDYEIVIHMTGRGRDNSQSGFTDEPIFHAYKLDGQLLWSIHLGKNIREGAHYTQFMVYDLDGDGKAELVCKTADGTVDGLGKVIGDPNADHRQQPTDATAETGRPTRTNENPRQDVQRNRARDQRFGYVLKGPEYLTVFNGLTGAAMATVDYVPQRYPDTHSPTPDQMNSIWGDNYGNRIDRFLACVAYLDGQRPSFVMCRGYYTRSVLAAWDWRDGKLTQRWVFDSDKLGLDAVENPWRGQGNHSVAVGDVDGDGKDEIVYGSMVIDDNGTGLYSTGLGHGDAQHMSDLDPSRPGLEIWSIHEKPPANRAGVELRNAKTGEVYFAAAHGQDVGRGMAADIDPRHPGYEMWGGTRNLFNTKGEDIGPRPTSQNMAIWWDGDLLRELLDGVNIAKWDYEAGRQVTLFDGRAAGVASNNGTKSNPCLAADILGDWREELIARTSDSQELRIYTTTVPTTYRLPTLMHDRQYRLSVAWQNVGYNQPPHPSYFLGHGMTPVK